MWHNKEAISNCTTDRDSHQVKKGVRFCCWDCWLGIGRAAGGRLASAAPLEAENPRRFNAWKRGGATITGPRRVVERSFWQ